MQGCHQKKKSIHLFRPKTWIFIHVAKSNEKFLKNPCFSMKMTFYFFFIQLMIPKSGCFSPKSKKLACFLLDSCFKFPRFSTIFPQKSPKNHVFSTFVTKIGKNWQKLENPCFFLDSYFKFPRFFHRNHRNPRFFHVGQKNFGFSTFCGNFHVGGNPESDKRKRQRGTDGEN